MNRTFSDTIRRARAKRGLTIREVASAVGVSKTTIANIEGEKKSPRLSTVYRLCEFYGLDADALIDQMLETKVKAS